MKKRHNNSTRASALQITLSVALISILASLLAAASFKAAPAGAIGQAPQKKPQQLDADGGRLFARLTSTPTRPSQPRQLSFGDRVAYQYAIEEVYWRHRIWPKERPDPKPSLDEVMSSAQIEQKVEDYLRNSQLLADHWQRPITPEQLQAEMERMVSHTKQPEVLRELFAALGNDPALIAECLARPALSDRLVRELYTHDPRFHGKLKRRAEVELRTHRSVKQMKRTSGIYSEMEWIRSDAADSAPSEAKNAGAIRMNSSEWQEGVKVLGRQFGIPAMVGRDSESLREQSRRARRTRTDSDATAKDPLARIKTGVLTPLQEDEGHYYASAVLKKGKDRLRVATVAWLKEPFESWATKTETEAPQTADALSAGYTLPAVGSPSTSCTNDTWTATSTTNAPAGRQQHSAVWTGSEMIVWGGVSNIGGYLNTGGRYNPGTDSWTATSLTGAPVARYLHTAVWTGSEMIVWGGNAGFNTDFSTGGRYNPGTDSWTATTTTNAPIARGYHTAVWTGPEMIVWGGVAGFSSLNTGGRYNPGTGSWTATSTTNAPAGRYYHRAVWTGSEMVIWGGQNSSLNTGGRYNPGTDSWTATSTTNAPTGRYLHTAVWTGSEMVIWGGYNGSLLNTGGRYNPGIDSWTATSTTNAPAGRFDHRAVWTGSEMIVWGGDNGSSLNTGGRYNLSTDSWTATSTTNAAARKYHTAIWTGSEMIVWGGYNGGDLNTGGRYCAPQCTAVWTATSTTNAPSARYGHTAVWTGSEMVIWGGKNDSSFFNTGGRYSPGTDSWTATSTTSAPAARGSNTAVWTGSEMIVWGGGGLNTGGRYNPGTNSWTATSTTNAPAARSDHTAVWTGSEMIVWGGWSGSVLNTGGKYDPSSNSWTAGGTSTTNAPAARDDHTAVWTGTEMIVWGGDDHSNALNTGGRYNPSTNIWIATSITNAPSVRSNHTAAWTGSEMIFWGGNDNTSYFNTGGKYNPGTNSWTAGGTSTTNAPASRNDHTAVWTGSEMIVWGGRHYDGVYFFVNTGGKYNPGTNTWTATSITNAPAGRVDHTAVWTGTEMIVWGGLSNGSPLNTGGKYCAQATFSISGSVNYCVGSARAVPDVTLSLSGDMSTSAMTDASGNYMFSFVPSGGNYNVMPSKADLAPGVSTNGINTTDALAVQRHFLGVALLSGCGLAAADVNESGLVDTTDALAIQQFYLFSPNPLPSANRAGQWRFSPASRSYPTLPSDQAAQSYNAYVLGDANGDLVFPSSAPELPVRTMSVSVPVAVAMVNLPNVDMAAANFTAEVTTSNIDAGDELVAFQGDLTFDSAAINFQSPPVARAGLTATGNWALAANVLGTGRIKILRVSCFALDTESVLSGEGPLFELRMTRVSSKSGASTQLVWSSEPNNFIFIDENLKQRVPASVPPGSLIESRSAGRR